MKKAYFVSIIISLLGVWVLYQGYSRAQDQSLSFTYKLVRILGGLVLASGGYLTYRFAKASIQQKQNSELEILTKVKMEKK